MGRCGPEGGEGGLRRGLVLEVLAMLTGWPAFELVSEGVVRMGLAGWTGAGGGVGEKEGGGWLGVVEPNELKRLPKPLPKLLSSAVICASRDSPESFGWSSVDEGGGLKGEGEGVDEGGGENSEEVVTEEGGAVGETVVTAGDGLLTGLYESCTMPACVLLGT